MSEQSKEQLRAQIVALVSQYGALVSQPKAFEPGITVVPPSGKVVGAREMELMVEASLDAWLTTGRFNDQFEERLAKFLGVKYLMTVNSGSSANLVAFSALTSPKLGDRAFQCLSMLNWRPTTSTLAKLKLPLAQRPRRLCWPIPWAIRITWTLSPPCARNTICG